MRIQEKSIMGFISRIRNVVKNKRIKSEDSFDYKKFSTVNVSKVLDENLKFLKELLKDSHDIVYRDIYVNDDYAHILMVYIDGMIEKEIVNNQILKPLMAKGNNDVYPKDICADVLKDKFLTASQIKIEKSYDKLLLSLLSGSTLLFIDNVDSALIVDSKGGETRAVEQPSSEQTTKGPREGFVENIQSNIVMVRRIIKDPNLAVEVLKVGRRTQTDVAIIYIKGIVREGLVEELKSRIAKIDTDSLIGSAPLEQLIEEHKWTIIPEILGTERPDKAAGHLLEGRVVAIVDGTPFVLVMPSTFAIYMNSPEDYYERAVFSSLLRLIRYMGYFISTSLMAIYLALTAYHPGMLPPQLALSITGTRVGLPFPVFVEVFMMEFILFILQEAAIRLPKQMGQTVSIVGGLVIGQSAVQAGLVSPIIIIIVALSAVASFTIPVYTFTQSSRVIRHILIIAAAVLGLYGVMMAWIFLLIHMASVKTFGVSYLSDFSPFSLNIFKDTIIKAPKSSMILRPQALKTQDKIRQKTIKKDERADE